MRVAVVGAGGVGGYFGGRLAQAGHDVTFVARGATLAALRARGLRLESPEGDLHLSPVRATDRPGEIGPVDLVVVATKAWQVPEAARAAAPLVGPGTMVLPLQNGVEASDQLAEVLGPGPVLVGLCRIIAFVEEPGVVRHLGVRPSIHLGERDNARSDRALRLAEALDRAPGLDAKVPSDVQVALWRKLVFIAPVSGIGAVTRAPLGVLRAVPETRDLVADAMEEVCRVGRARGVALAPDTAEQTVAFLDSLPPDGTTSMQRDLAEGRPSELEAQVGAVVRLGRAAGVATPVHRVLYGALLPLERRARGEPGWPPG